MKTTVKIFNKFIPQHVFSLFQKKQKNTLINSKNVAFTLFEVLIVMTILGIIATIMVSSVKPQEYKEKAMATAAKKVMNEIDHATSMILTNDSLDGTMHNLVATDGTTFSIAGDPDLARVTKLANLYKKYLVTTRKACSDTTCQCYKKDTENARTTSVYFYLKDGACIGMGLANSAGNSIFPGETSTVKVNREGRIRFEVNDAEDPNAYGKDMFLIPIGASGILWDATAVANGDDD